MENTCKANDSALIQVSGSEIISSLAQDSQVFVFAYCPKLKSLVSCSDNIEQLLGAKHISVAHNANLFLRYVHPEDRFFILSDIERALRGDRNYCATYRWIRPDNNEVRWLHCRASLVQKEDGERIFEGLILDLSDDFNNSADMSLSSDSLSTVISSFPNMIITLDKDLRLLRIHRPTSKEYFQFNDASFKFEVFSPGRLFLDCFSSDEARSHFESLLLPVLEGLEDYIKQRFVIEEQVASLAIYPIKARESIEGLLLLITDASEVLKLESKLAKLEKAEGLYTIAMGLAHNFNNALQSIMGQAIAIRDNCAKRVLVKQASQVIFDVAKKASDLSNQLFELDDFEEDFLMPIDINLATMAAVKKVEDLFSSGIKISVAFGNPPIIYTNRTRLESIIEKTLRSVKEISKDDSSINISTYQVSLNEKEVQDLKKGLYAKLTISDIRQDETLVSNITESIAELNAKLSHVGGIARRLRGALQVEASPERDLIVSLYFPIPTDNKVIPQSFKTPKPVKQEAEPNILIIDDDLLVLETVERVLANAGYNCLVAEDFHKALSLAKTHAESFQLILLDALMPGIDGARLLKKLRRIKSDFQVIGFSGAPPEVTKSLLEEGAIQILRKPVEPATLLGAVKSTLEAHQAA